MSKPTALPLLQNCLDKLPKYGLCNYVGEAPHGHLQSQLEGAPAEQRDWFCHLQHKFPSLSLLVEGQRKERFTNLIPSLNAPHHPHTLSEFSNLSSTLQHFLILPASNEARVADENAHGHTFAAFGRIMGGRGCGETFQKLRAFGRADPGFVLEQTCSS